MRDIRLTWVLRKNSGRSSSDVAATDVVLPARNNIKSTLAEEPFVFILLILIVSLLKL